MNDYQFRQKRESWESATLREYYRKIDLMDDERDTGDEEYGEEVEDDD